MPLEKGTTLAGYRIEGILGQGGMGVVYEATQISLKRTVALKVLAPHLSDDVLFRERFQREGQLQAGIDHHHIVTVYDSGETDHGFFIAMRLIRGPNLKDMIVSRELDPGRTLRILDPIADALDTAHQAELIHRDIKPQNILVGGRDQAFLADFGLTKATGEKSLTRTGQFVGTFDYISPEQIMGERATSQSDVYALTAVLYECFTGVVPYPKQSEAAVLYAHMADPPPKISDQRPELPASLDEVVATGMAKDAVERYTSARQLLLEANRTFTRRMRAAFTPPRPIEAAQETGIRPPEADVPTRQREPPTEPAALEAETVSPARGRAEPAGPPPETAPAEPAAGETAASGRPGEVTAPGAARPEPTAPGAARPDATAPGTVPEGTAAGAAIPDATVLRDTDPAARGATASGEAVRRRPSKTRPPGRSAAVPAATRQEAAAGVATPSAPRTRPARAPRAGALVGLAAAAALLIVVAGFLVGSSGGESERSAPAADNLVAKGALDLNFPDSWRRAVDPPAIPGLGLRDRIAATRRGGSADNALTAGMTGATNPALLPSTFLERLPETPKRDDAVKLGDLQAYRYRNLRPEGLDGRLTLYVSPTTEGVVTVACAGTAAFLPSCEEVAGGLVLSRGEQFALGADTDYLARLDKTIDRLNADRKKDVAELRKAKRRAGQAKAADALAGDYRRARRSLEGLSISPAVQSANAGLRAALARTERAYGRLADAARRGSEGAYDAAGGDVRAGESAVRRALSRVNEASK